MRIGYIAMVVVLIAGSLLAVGVGRAQADAQERALVATQGAVRRLNKEIRVHSAIKDCELNGRGWPISIDPQWFGHDLPRNMLVDQGLPWLEVASDADLELEHPSERLVTSRADAAFWYNPAKGIVRARVGSFVSDERGLDAYNRVNTCSLKSLFGAAETPAKSAH